MNLLNACLALALTLGIFASVVTVLVEMIYQTIQQRARDLQGMLGFVFDAVFAGEKDLQKLGLDVVQLRKDFTYKLRSDRVLDALVEKHSTVLRRIVGRRIANDTSMTLETFLRRLDRSEVYEKYLKVLNPENQEMVVKALVEQFGRGEKAISEFFRVRAKLVSYLVGVGLAVVVNVDAARLFEYFSANPAATEAAITRLQGVLEEAGKASGGDGGSQPGGRGASEADAPSPDTAPAEKGAEEGRAVQALASAGEPGKLSLSPAQRQEVEGMLYRLRNSQAFGLPVGWAYYPYCVPPEGIAQLDPQCPPSARGQGGQPAQAAASAQTNGKEGANAAEKKDQTIWQICVAGFRNIIPTLADIHSGGRPLFWLLSVVVTGFLLGLGGPYWFDLAMALSRFRDFLKTGQAKSATQAAPTPKPEELVAAFLERAGKDPIKQEGRG